MSEENSTSSPGSHVPLSGGQRGDGGESKAPGAGEPGGKGRGGGLLRSSGVIAFGTVISRILGLVRDNVILSLFPLSVTDPFFVAFRIPNTLRRLFAEGALSSAFIPVFSRARHEDSEEEVSRFAGSLFRFLFLVLLGISALGVLAAPFVIRILAPGFVEDEDLFDLTVRLTRIMFPFILLIGLAALTMGMLNTFHRFFIPSVASAFLNLAIIGGAAGSLVYYRGNASITWVAGGVLTGGVLQWLVQWFDLRNATPVALGGSGWWHPRIRQVAVLFLPAVLGQAVMQLNILVDTYFASRIDGGNTYLYAANRIMQFPLGVYGIAVATAAFPRLSGLAAAGDREAFTGTFDRAVRGILFILAPCAVGLAFFGRDAIGLLFNHGEFEAEGSLEPTLWALWAYITGLVVFAVVKVAVSACYALSDTRWPLWTGTAAVASNIVLDAVLVRTPLAHAGLALATSISSFINLILLMLVLRYSHRVEGVLRPFGLVFRAFGAALLASLPLYLLLEALFPAGLSTMRFAVRTLGAMAIGAGLYIVAARWLMPREWEEINKAAGGRR